MTSNRMDTPTGMTKSPTPNGTPVSTLTSPTPTGRNNNASPSSISPSELSSVSPAYQPSAIDAVSPKRNQTIPQPSKTPPQMNGGRVSISPTESVSSLRQAIQQSKTGPVSPQQKTVTSTSQKYQKKPVVSPVEKVSSPPKNQRAVSPQRIQTPISPSTPSSSTQQQRNQTPISQPRTQTPVSPTAKQVAVSPPRSKSTDSPTSTKPIGSPPHAKPKDSPTRSQPSISPVRTQTPVQEPKDSPVSPEASQDTYLLEAGSRRNTVLKRVSDIEAAKPIKVEEQNYSFVSPGL